MLFYYFFTGLADAHTSILDFFLSYLHFLSALRANKDEVGYVKWSGYSDDAGWFSLGTCPLVFLDQVDTFDDRLVLVRKDIEHSASSAFFFTRIDLDEVIFLDMEFHPFPFQLCFLL